MDDWSNHPSRQAVSKPAPDHQSPLSNTHHPDCQTQPAASSATTGADQPCPPHRRLTRQASPGNTATKPGHSPETPLLPDDPDDHHTNITGKHQKPPTAP